MKIKLPPMYDTSRYEVIPDFAQVTPKPLLVATKATEGSTWVDPTFAKYWADLKQDGIHRAAYHFFRKAIASAPQAQLFINTVTKSGVDQKDIFVLDVEEAGTSATQIIAWLDIVENVFSNIIMIYSRANILNPISMTATQKARLRTYPIWTAGYPANPDVYDSPMLSYIPDQTKWGRVWAWQYSEDGIVQGIEGEVDLNWMSPELISYLGAVTPPAGEVMEKYKVIGSNGLNLRRSPVSGEVILLSPINTVIWGAKGSDGWIHGTHYQKPGDAYAIPLDFYCAGSTSYVAALVYSPPVVAPPPSDNAVLAAIAALDTKVSSIKTDVEVLSGVHVTILHKLDSIKSDTAEILSGTPTIPPPPANDLLDYSGAYVGEYEVIDDGNDVKWIGVQDSYGRDTSQINADTVKWLQETDPGSWDWFVKQGVLTKNSDGLWFTKLRIYRGQKVRIAEINTAKNTGRVIGFSVSTNQPTSICVHTPAPVDWLRWKIQGQPFYYWNIQPWRTPKDTVPNALYVPMAWLKKV